MQFRRLLEQYCLDIYVKFEMKRLTFIWLNQTKLCLEKYIHLRDAIRTDGGGDAAYVCHLTILLATYTDSPPYMFNYEISRHQISRYVN